MTDKITLTNLVNLQNETTAVNAINANNAVIVAAFDNTLSRDGTSPNTMSASLDLNGNQLLNQGAPSYTFATLPASPMLGQLAVVTDAGVNPTWGTALAIGGFNTKLLVWFNGLDWTVIGK